MEKMYKSFITCKAYLHSVDYIYSLSFTTISLDRKLNVPPRIVFF